MQSVKPQPDATSLSTARAAGHAMACSSRHRCILHCCATRAAGSCSHVAPSGPSGTACQHSPDKYQRTSLVPSAPWVQEQLLLLLSRCAGQSKQAKLEHVHKTTCVNAAFLPHQRCVPQLLRPLPMRRSDGSDTTHSSESTPGVQLVLQYEISC